MPWDPHAGDHAADAGHAGLDHATGHAEATSDHGQCDAWTVETAEHERHDAARFETAERPRHHHHAAICGLCLHAAVDVPREADRSASLDSADRLASASGHQLASAAHLPRRSRAPPLA